MFQNLEKIKKGRLDLSNYLIHFTRTENSSSFETLKQIVISGRINCSWSIRNGKRTIFGNKPAICFTEMPLHSFFCYATNRKDFSKTDFYGIAVHKQKMFKLGARNVIYGTSSEDEIEAFRNNEEGWNPNLPISEQYRYMLTDIDDKNDWTHEREWRWINHFQKSKGDYLPLWQNDTYNKRFGGDREFSHQNEIIIIVRTRNEVDELASLFSTFTDREIYNHNNISNTIIISLEGIQTNKEKFDHDVDFGYILSKKIYNEARP